MDRLVRVERNEAAKALGKAGTGMWVEVATAWASIVDALPSRGERLADGMNVATRPSRVRMDWDATITASMRMVDVTDGVDGRVMQIITPPARLGGDGMEMMVEDYSPSPKAG